MASASDPELQYLSSSFDPASLTVPKLRAILVEHDISYPASAKKPQLIDIFTQELVPRARKILTARLRTKRTSRGITDMPSSQEATVDGDEDDDTSSMPPPPVRDTPKRKPRKSGRVAIESNATDSSANGKAPSTRRSSGKHARPSDTETELELENKRPLVSKSRRSEAKPSIKGEESEYPPVRPSLGESPFSHDNPFQSGSSPQMQSESRRRSGGVKGERRKSSNRRRTELANGAEPSSANQGDRIVVPSAKTFEIPGSKLLKRDDSHEEDDGVEIGEDFTPEARLELARERAANGYRDVLPLRKKKSAKTPSSLPKSAPWVVLITLLSGYAMWWRQEKLEVGYCGVGRPSNLRSNVQIPQWISSLQPECEACPQHAICYERMQTKCEQDFVLQPHPLSLGGLVPIPPSCEPDGEKVLRVKAVADRAIEELRERKAQWECGTLVNDRGKTIPAVELDEKSLKEALSQKRRRGMGQAEFEDLWRAALGEITGREEVVHSVDGSLTSQTDVHPASSSLPTLSPDSPSAAPSADPSASRWRDIESSLLL